jgi:ribosomal protein L21
LNWLEKEENEERDEDEAEIEDVLLITENQKKLKDELLKWKQKANELSLILENKEKELESKKKNNRNERHTKRGVHRWPILLITRAFLNQLEFANKSRNNKEMERIR